MNLIYLFSFKIICKWAKCYLCNPSVSYLGSDTLQYLNHILGSLKSVCFFQNNNPSVTAGLFWDLVLQDVICLWYDYIFVNIYNHMYKIINNQEYYVGTDLYNLFCFYDPIKKMLYAFHRNEFT